jgi:hypothetical protein
MKFIGLLSTLFTHRKITCWLILGIFSLLSSCKSVGSDDLTTPLPTQFWPTAIAMTLESSGVDLSTPTKTSPTAPISMLIETSTPTSTRPPTATPTQAPTLTEASPLTITVESPLVVAISPQSITETPDGSTPTPYQVVLPGPPEETPPPEIPEARVQIYQIGELSLVTSPIQVSARLTSKNGKVVRVDLYGEDGRLLAREVRVYNNVPWQEARIGTELEFEINGISELGRLLISVEDEYGRLIDANSVNLILLSQGSTELKPYSALWQRIIIQEPVPRALIQGGMLIVSGRVRPTNSEQPLKVLLMDEEGHVLGQRLANMTIPIPGDYGSFAAEVPYTVSDITSALLVVFEDGGQLSDIAHLTSQEVILAP